MSKVISFRATDRHVEILDMAERIYQKPMTAILAGLVENDLKQRLIQDVAAGRRPMPFNPPKQRLVKRRGRNAAPVNPG